MDAEGHDFDEMVRSVRGRRARCWLVGYLAGRLVASASRVGRWVEAADEEGLVRSRPIQYTSTIGHRRERPLVPAVASNDLMLRGRSYAKGAFRGTRVRTVRRRTEAPRNQTNKAHAVDVNGLGHLTNDSSISSSPLTFFFPSLPFVPLPLTDSLTPLPDIIQGAQVATKKNMWPAAVTFSKGRAGWTAGRPAGSNAQIKTWPVH